MSDDPVAAYMVAVLFVRRELESAEDDAWHDAATAAWLQMNEQQHAEARLRCSGLNRWSREQRQRAEASGTNAGSEA